MPNRGNPQQSAENGESPFKRRRRRAGGPMVRIGAMILLGLAIGPDAGGAILFQEEEASGGIRCFCDKKNCGGGALVCAGKRCLIGVRTEGEEGQGRLDQHCVEEAEGEGEEEEGERMERGGCRRDWRKWSEVCVCEEHLCNTWAFLRARMDSLDLAKGQHRHNRQQQRDEARMGGAVERSLYEPGERQQGSYDDNGDDFHRQHQFYRNSDPLDTDYGGPSATVTGGRRGPALILLLVVLPLAVGAFTVFLVFLNYHCKML